MPEKTHCEGPHFFRVVGDSRTAEANVQTRPADNIPEPSAAVFRYRPFPGRRMAFQFAKPDFDHTRFIHAQLPDSFPADHPAFGEITDAVVRLKL